MSSNIFSNMPKVLRGAIVGVEPTKSLSQVILFQYNPQQLTRTLDPQVPGNDSSSQSEMTYLKGVPSETINLEIEIDAADQLDKSDLKTVALGIYPQLSALELLTYPKSYQVINNMQMLAAGMLEIIPSESPLTLLVWGIKRVLPVQITSFTITEEAHDAQLNPIRAHVVLGLKVLNYNDLPMNNIGYHLFLANQIAKEMMAKQSYSVLR